MIQKKDLPLLLGFFGIGGAVFIIIGHLQHNEFLRIGGIVFMLTCVAVGFSFLIRNEKQSPKGVDQ